MQTAQPAKRKRKPAQTTFYDVQPLRTQQEIDDMKESLGRWCLPRDRFMFVLGINTGLRISDLLKWKVKDVRNKDARKLIEQKTGKPRIVNFLELQEEIEAYTKGMDDEDWLFASRKGGTPISTTQAYRALVKAGQMIDRTDIGTHTCRKTFGYHYYKLHKDVAALQEILNHSTPAITRRYIGITQEEIAESLRGFKL